jgi:hypothetical protein
VAISCRVIGQVGSVFARLSTPASEISLGGPKRNSSIGPVSAQSFRQFTRSIFPLLVSSHWTLKTLLSFSSESGPLIAVAHAVHLYVNMPQHSVRLHPFNRVRCSLMIFLFLVCLCGLYEQKCVVVAYWFNLDDNRTSRPIHGNFTTIFTSGPNLSH